MTLPSNEQPIRYMERTRNYYRALGYDNDYAWATFEEVPFARPSKPVAEMRIGLITTASPLQLENRDARGIRHVWSGDVAPPPPRLFTDNVAWDKESTHTDDRGSYLPIEAAVQLASEGSFGAVAPRFHGVPTEYSQRKTLEEDAPEILRRLRQDDVDAAILIPL